MSTSKNSAERECGATAERARSAGARGRSPRRRQKGAAMTEMVLTLPVALTMWFGIDYFRSGYARRLEAMHKARAAAWASAYSNDGSCFANKEPWAGFTGENDAMDPSNTGEKGAEAATQFSGNTSSSMFMYAHTNKAVSMKTKTARFDGSQGQVGGRAYITCNEVVPGGANFADQNVLTPLWDFVKSIF
jgi:hypothetical protein